MTANILDLAILDAGSHEAIALGRCDSDIAITHLPLDKELPKLESFRKRIELALRGYEKRPSHDDLTNYGREIFAFCIREQLAKLYDQLSQNHIRIHILSDHPQIRAIPWEYFQEPDQNPGPRIVRSIVRIVSSIGQPPLKPLDLSQQVRVLFVSAEPTDQEPMSWPDVRDEIESTFLARFNHSLGLDNFKFKTVDGTTRTSLLDALTTNERYDIFHFSGHGKVNDEGVGCLLLTDRTTKKSDPLPADKLAGILSGRGIRLVVLSACETASGDFKDNFSVLAEALVRAGVPAVVANQLPVPNKTVATFVAAMYRELLVSGDIDRAVGEGRIRLNIDLGSSPDAVLEWGIPTVYRHIAAAQLFLP